MRPIWRNTLGVATVAIVAATAAAPTSAFGQGSGAPPRPIVGSRAAQATSDAPKTVTLITGDKVLVTGAGTNAPIVTVLPREDGTVPSVETRRVGKDVYVYPADAVDALSSDKVDEELFNVTGLVAMGYDDASTDSVPVIARYSTDLSRARSAPATPKGAAKGQTLHSIDGIALKAGKAQAAAFFAEATDPSTAAGAKIEKIWLDAKAYATLDQSTKQVGADLAWASGLKGSGTKVAVLDTGADAEHPDLQGRILASKDFTGSAGGALSDVHGHGTHTASTVGGSGAASAGLEKGVAPETQLLIGKVLGDSGGGSDSMIIGGMEWAVGQGADVVSMSLGSNGVAVRLQRPHVVGGPGARHDEQGALRHRCRQHRLGQQHRLGSRLCSRRADGGRRGPSGRAGMVLQPRAHSGRPHPQAGDLGAGRRHHRRALRRAGRQRVRRDVGHVDGDAARRRCRRHRQAGAPDLDRAAAQGGPRVVGEVRRPR